MALLLFIVMPLVIPNLVFRIISRQRSSLLFSALIGMLSSAAGILLSFLWLIPQERMRLLSQSSMLYITAGKSSIILLMMLYFLIGAAAGLLLREEKASAPASPNRHPVAAGISLFLLFVLLFLSQGYLWGKTAYGNTTLDIILFYLNMPLEGTSVSFTQSVLHSVLLPALLAFIPILCFCTLPKRHHYHLVLLRSIRLPLFPVRLPLPIVYPLLLLWFVLLAVKSNSMLKFDSFIDNRLNASTFIEENYVSPDAVSIVFPEKKRNLITVYLESYETTPQDVASGGILDVNLIPEMTQIAKEHVSFSRNDLITGAAVPRHCSWTMSGLIAQTAGLPLLNIVNEGQYSGSLLPAAITLGDLLKEQDYNLMFMAGSDFTFGGRRAYYGSHGDYEIWDLNTARENGILPIDYYQGWGFEDVKLYEFAKEKILELAQSDKPFHFSMLTVDTHNPGYRCPLCPTDYQNVGFDALNYADSLRCSSMQFQKFLSWCQEQPFYENTTIVVTGDHVSMQEFFYRNLLGSEEAASSIDRYVYNAFINSAVTPVQETNRLFTTIDIFPTTLASLGVTIEGNRLALGTNLFSDRETLSEQYGEELLFAELEKKSIFYEENLLYRSDEP